MKKEVAALGVFVLLFPLFVHAFPFGGRASIVLNCVYNSTIYANLGPPRGGEYVWTKATRTYQFGPPSHAGQWMLGLAGAPSYCFFKRAPVIIYTAIAMTMVGTSGPAAPPAPPTSGPRPLAPGETEAEKNAEFCRNNPEAAECQTTCFDGLADEEGNCVAQ